MKKPLIPVTLCGLPTADREQSGELNVGSDPGCVHIEVRTKDDSFLVFLSESDASRLIFQLHRALMDSDAERCRAVQS